MSNQFPSSPSHSSIASSPISENNQRKRPNRGKKKKNQSEEFESAPEEDEGSFDGASRKPKSALQLGIGSKIIRKADPKLKRTAPPQAPAAATFLYKPGVELPNLTNYLNQIIEIRIAVEYIEKSNPALIMRQIWGSGGIYASHSDPVCIGLHAGLLVLNDLKLGGHFYQGVALYCKVIKGKKSLNGALKVPLLSRSLKNQCAHCLKPEKIAWLTEMGSPEQLISWAKKMSLPSNRRLTKRNHLSVFCHEQPIGINPENLLLKNLPPLNEGWLIWDMSNDPSQKYNLITFMDRQTSNFKTNQSFKLRSHCLYIETMCEKYEISMDSKLIDEEVFLESKAYRIAEVLNPTHCDLEYVQRNGVPLPVQDKKVLEDKLRWDQFKWGNDSLIVADKFQIKGLKCFKFVPLTKHHI